MPSRAAPWMVLCLLLPACSRQDTDPSAGTGPVPPAPTVEAWLVDHTARLGLPVEQAEYPRGTFDLREIMGPGVGLFDADQDGDLDLIEVRCRPPGSPDAPAPNRFWEQQADGTFRDRTDASGLGDPGDGQGVACGDVDNDGDVDVLFVNFGPDRLYRNEGDGTFTDVTEEAGLVNHGWTCSAAFADHDGDGFLDLFLVNYVKYDPHTTCAKENSEPEYCGPLAYGPVLDALYHNDGDGTFTEVTLRAGIHEPGTGLGVAACDLTGDGRVDYYVTNDALANHLWVNQGDGTFQDEALMRGVGLNRHGKAEASMGVVVGDVNGDGLLDLFMTHLRNENNTLYTGMGGGVFEDRSVTSQLSSHDLFFTGFGCGLLDLELDGDLDLALVNGRVKKAAVHPGAALGPFWNDYAEPNLLFLNDGTGRFAPEQGEGGVFTRTPRIGRGLAFGDLDQDGDVDLVASFLASPLQILLNEAPRVGHWLQVVAQEHGRHALGAKVWVEAGGRVFLRPVMAGGSYASSSDPTASFGLGAPSQVDAIRVQWTDGTLERFPGGAADRRVVVRRGTGVPE